MIYVRYAALRKKTLVSVIQKGCDIIINISAFQCRPKRQQLSSFLPDMFTILI